MAEAKRIEGPTEVGKGEYKAQSTMTPEQQAEAAKKHKAAKERAMGEKSKRYQAPNVTPERLGGGKTEAELNQAPRKPGEKPGEGKIQKVTPKVTPKVAPKGGGLTEEEMNIKAPGYYRKGRYMKKPPPKPKKDLTATTLGGTKQKTPSQMGVDVKTGKPKPTKTYGERAISYLEGLGTKVAPPGSVTRLREKPEGPPSTMKTRMESIGRVSAKSFPGREKASRPGGILNIPELAGRSKGPSLKAQQGTPAAAYRRKRYRERTAADVPGHGKGPVTPSVKGVEVLAGPGELGKGHLGSYKLHRKAEKPQIVEKQEARKETTRTKAAAPKVPWYMRAAKAFQKAGREMTAQAKTSTAPSGKYGTKEQAQKVKKGAKKAVVPKTFKEKK